jgi:hypothetical protein
MLVITLTLMLTLILTLALMLTHTPHCSSQFFVGNSQSSFSQNIARVRKAVYKDADRLQVGGRAALGAPRHVQSFLDMNAGNLRKDGNGIVEGGD